MKFFVYIVEWINCFLFFFIKTSFKIYIFSISVSAFYAEHSDKKISFAAYVWTKSKFLGLSIGVHNIGQGVITLCDKNEEYTVTFPNGYGRWISIINMFENNINFVYCLDQFLLFLGLSWEVLWQSIVPKPDITPISNSLQNLFTVENATKFLARFVNFNIFRK